MLPEFLYSINEDSIYFDIYSSSELTWERENNTVGVGQVTDMPYGGKVKITISCQKSEKFKVMLRIPAWAEKEVEITSGEQQYIGIPGSYLCIEKIWESGAEHMIEFELKFRWNLTRYTGTEQIPGFERCALEYGPLLMVAVSKLPEDLEGGDYLGLFKFKLDPADFKSWLIGEKDKNNLRYTVKGHENISYMPYFEVETGRYFTCYPLYFS
jgi:DUF1680 family protein